MIENLIKFKKPVAKLLHATPLDLIDLAARVTTDKISDSKNQSVIDVRTDRPFQPMVDLDLTLADKVANAYHHTSIIEHVTCNFYLVTTRGVLQELARHRIASYSVRSTRYTMASMIGVFLAIATYMDDFDTDIKQAVFRKVMSQASVPLLWLEDNALTILEYNAIYNKLEHMLDLNQEFLYGALSSKQEEALNLLEPVKYINNINNIVDYFSPILTVPGKKNIGDRFKHIVSDTWSVDLLWSINLRSLKNFMQLRNHPAAYKEIRRLAETILDVLPDDYKKFIL